MTSQRFSDFCSGQALPRFRGEPFRQRLQNKLKGPRATTQSNKRLVPWRRHLLQRPDIPLSLFIWTSRDRGKTGARDDTFLTVLRAVTARRTSDPETNHDWVTWWNRGVRIFSLALSRDRFRQPAAANWLALYPGINIRATVAHGNLHAAFETLAPSHEDAI